MDRPSDERREGERFDFGRNWANFLKKVNEERISEAERSLKEMLEVDRLEGKSFLDIGSGSGLFSLAARRLGARVYSFDFDPFSVACTAEMKRRYFPDDANWTVARGDVLDQNYLRSLGQFDFVYAWGVLHHTGNMWQALENVTVLVAGRGRLHLSIYNDQGIQSLFWRRLKRFYVRSSKPLRMLIVLWIGLIFETRGAVNRLIQKKNPLPFKDWSQKKKARGMSTWHDLVDWVGGYPFEVAKPHEIFSFYHAKGFLLNKLKTCAGGIGCNEYVFIRGDQTSY